MKVYLSDPKTGEYCGEYECPPNPLEGGFLIPPNGHEEKPNTKTTFDVAVWENDAWAYYEDHRGETVYHTETIEKKEIKEIGSIPSGYTNMIPPSPFFHVWDERTQKWIADIAQLKEQKRNEIKYEYENEITSRNRGFISQTLGKKIDCRKSDVENLQTLINILESRGITEHFYKCYDDTKVTCTTAQIKQILLEIQGELLRFWGVKDTLLSNIAAAATIAEVQAIIWEVDNVAPAA